jgi:hypothetical protein
MDYIGILYMHVEGYMRHCLHTSKLKIITLRVLCRYHRILAYNGLLVVYCEEY